MIIRRIAGCILCVLLCACTAPQRHGEAISEKPVNEAQTPPGMSDTVMNVAADHYEKFIVPYNDGDPIKIKAQISEPHPTAQFSSSILFCAQGLSLADQACLWFIVQADRKSLAAVSYIGHDIEELKKHWHGFYDMQGVMDLRLKLDEKSMTIFRNDVEVATLKTNFELYGYGYGCVAAKCEFLAE